MSTPISQLSSSQLPSSQLTALRPPAPQLTALRPSDHNTQAYLRKYWQWRIDLWFDVYKGHPEKCECEDCFNRFCEFFEWSRPAFHEEFCDCDFCIPASSTFCVCAECIPDIVEFDKIGEIPFVPGPHSDLCKCFQCVEEDS